MCVVAINRIVFPGNPHCVGLIVNPDKTNLTLFEGNKSYSLTVSRLTDFVSTAMDSSSRSLRSVPSWGDVCSTPSWCERFEDAPAAQHVHRHLRMRTDRMMAPRYPAYQDETVGKNTCTSCAHQPYARRLDSSCIVCLADECCVAVRGTLSTLVARFCPLRSGADPHP